MKVFSFNGILEMQMLVSLDWAILSVGGRFDFMALSDAMKMSPDIIKTCLVQWHHQNSLSATQGLLCWHWFHQNVLGATVIIKMVSAPRRDCFNDADIIKLLLVRLASSNWSRRHTGNALMTMGPLHGGASLNN